MNAKQVAEKLKQYGRYGDTELVHMSKGEVTALRGLAQVAGGDLTRNPHTGQPEAFFLAALLPTILGGVGSAMGLGAVGTAALGAGAGALLNRSDPLMGAITGGLGGFGGGQLASGLTGLGAGAAQNAAVSGLTGPGHLANTMAAGVDPMLANAVRPELLAQGASGAAPATNLAAAQAAQQFAAQPFYSQMGQGAQALMQQGGPSQFMQGMGGPMRTMQAVGMAAAPMLMQPPATSGEARGAEGDAEIPAYDFRWNPTGARARGSEEVRHFSPTFTRRAASGGLMQFAEGGHVPMQSGGFVIPADVTAYAGGGSTDAGQQRLAQALGARPIRGPGDGLSDDIPASIDGQQPARVANGEMYVGAEQVARVGGGDHRRGVRKLYSMLDNVRKQAVGHTRQVKQPNLKKALA